MKIFLLMLTALLTAFVFQEAMAQEQQKTETEQTHSTDQQAIDSSQSIDEIDESDFIDNPTSDDANYKPLLARTNRCFASIQDKIEWDYKGNSRWAQTNLERMCENGNETNQPAKCFNSVMHGNFSWGGNNNNWRWQYALELCKGTYNAKQTMQCFTKRIDQGYDWRSAIKGCRSKPKK